MSPVLSLTFCKSLLDMSRCWIQLQNPSIANPTSLPQFPLQDCQDPHRVSTSLSPSSPSCPPSPPPPLSATTHPSSSDNAVDLIDLLFPRVLQSVSSSSPTLLPLICTTLELLKLNPRLRQFQHPLSDASSTKIYHHHHHHRRNHCVTQCDSV